MHESVLLKESIEYLNLKETSVIVDCTLGYGGHSSHILKEIKKGFLFAFDQDHEAIASSEKRLREVGNNFCIIQSNFVHLKEELQKRKIDRVVGVLFDLGVSSPQLDEGERGFSFHQDARLDMRMDQSNPLSAYEVVNTYSYGDLVRIFRDYGEEKYATSIASSIVKSREIKPIETTIQLVDIIKGSVPEKYKREHHPARKVFQAIRIEVNHELDVFESALRQALELISVGGRICVITFHSLEDRLCKQIFKEVSSIPKELRGLPMIPSEYEPKFEVLANIEPSREELEHNHRSRSARLRVITRIKE